MTRSSRSDWPAAIIWLHWGAAVLAIATAIYGLYLLSPPDWSQPYLDRYWAGIRLHKLGGISVLAFALVWLGLRAVVPRPPLAERGLMRCFIRLVHGTLLVLVILLPLSGYVMDTFAGNGIALPGGLEIPPLLPRNESASIALSQVHKWAGLALLGLAALHIVGALRHAKCPGDENVLRAMLPFRASEKVNRP